MLYGAVVVERGAGAVVDRFIGNRPINPPYPVTGLPYPGKLEPVAVGIGPRYGTAGPFRLPGACWSALLAWKRATTPCCVAGPEAKRHA